jgi:FtsP/CotA-like multicopper oxidase with cupredoxin domain
VYIEPKNNPGQYGEVDFTPAMEGLTLFHCHQQLHMDYGLKTLFNVA